MKDLGKEAKKDLLYNRKTKIRNRCECGATQTFVMDGAGIRGGIVWYVGG